MICLRILERRYDYPGVTDEGLPKVPRFLDAGDIALFTEEEAAELIAAGRAELYR